MTELAFVDTETLGLDADHQPVWEVGLIDSAGAEHHWFLQVTPRELTLAHPMALEIGRFDERYDPLAATSPALFAHHFAGLVRGCHLVGAVVSFDEERIRRMCWAAGAPVTWHYHIIDVEPLAAGYVLGQFVAIQDVGRNPEADGPTQEEVEQALPPWDSNSLSLAVGVDPEDFDRHTALGDARWAKALYEAVLGGAS